jgi:site-specific DNA-methyltransferase (adenine-specific)/modification methylase
MSDGLVSLNIIADTPLPYMPSAVEIIKSTKRDAQALGSLFEGDCLGIMKKLPSESIDMVLCDLPYGTTQNPWDSQIDLTALWHQYLRLLKPRGVVCLTAQGMFTAQLMLSMEKYFKYRLVWVKSKPTNFLNVRKQPLRKFEDVCVFYRQQPNYFPQMTSGAPYNKGVRKDQLSGSYGDFSPVRVASNGERFPTDVIYFPTAESEGTVWHPTQKPVALGRYLIRSYTEPNAVVLDNAFGSGSFIVAAAQENRQFIGIEMNKDSRLFKDKKIDLMDVAKKRLDEIGVIATIHRNSSYE